MNDGLLAGLAKVVVGSAPLLASALGSPLSGLVVSAIAAAFGLDARDPAVSSNLAQVVQGDPEAHVKLAKVEAENSAGLMLAMASFEDVKDARQREIAIDKVLGRSEWVMPCLAFLISFELLGIVVGIMFQKIDPSIHDVLYKLIGIVGTTFTQCYQYYFGSSRGK